MAGFYGNIRNATNNSLKFDRIYSNRTIMEQNEQTDGVFGGRYVLVEYDQPLTQNPVQAIAINAYKVQVGMENNRPVYKYFRDYSFKKGDVDYIVFNDEIKIEDYIPHEVTSGEEGAETTEIVNNYYGQVIHEIELSFSAMTEEAVETKSEIDALEAEIEQAKTNHAELEVIQELEQELNEKQNYYNNIKDDRVVIKTGMSAWTPADNPYDISYLYVPKNRLSDFDIENNEHIIKNDYWYIYDDDNRKRAIDGNNEDNYVINYAIDKINYGNGRGYDSTVWRKVFSQNGEAKYIMLAELNSVVPTLSVTADAPSDIPLKPHFDEDSTNVYYNLHLQSPWGFRVAPSDVKAYINDERDSEGQLKKQELLAYKHQYKEGGKTKTTIRYASDFPVIGYQGKVFDPNGHYITREVKKYDSAIYFNKSGFDKNIVNYSPNEIQDNFIRIDENSSGQKYNNQDTTNPEKQAYPDVKELSVILPAIGDTVAEVWDILYGGKKQLDPIDVAIGANKDGDIITEQKYIRKPNITWEDANFVSDFSENKLRLSPTVSANTQKYKPQNLETVAGVINSVHDLMGMIITEQPLYDTPSVAGDDVEGDLVYPPKANANRANPLRIYYVPENYWAQKDQTFHNEYDGKYFYAGVSYYWDDIPYEQIKNVQIGDDASTKGTAKAFKEGFGEPAPITQLKLLDNINEGKLFTNYENANIYVAVPEEEKIAQPGALYYNLPSTLKYAGNIGDISNDEVYYYIDNNTYIPITVEQAKEDAKADPPINRNYYKVETEQLCWYEEIPHFDNEDEIFNDNTVYVEQKILKTHILNGRFCIKKTDINLKTREPEDKFLNIQIEKFNYAPNYAPNASVYQGYLDGDFRDHIDFVEKLGIGQKKYLDGKSTVLSPLDGYDVEHIYMDLGTKIELVDDETDPTKKVYREVRKYGQIDLNTVIFHSRGNTEEKFYEKNDENGTYTERSWLSIASRTIADQDKIFSFTNYYSLKKEERSLPVSGVIYCYFDLGGDKKAELEAWIEEWENATEEEKSHMDFNLSDYIGSIGRFYISSAENEFDFNSDYRYFIVPSWQTALKEPVAYGMMARPNSFVNQQLNPFNPENNSNIKRLYTDGTFYFKNTFTNEYEIASSIENDYIYSCIYDLDDVDSIQFFRTDPSRYYIRLNNKIYVETQDTHKIDGKTYYEKIDIESRPIEYKKYSGDWKTGLYEAVDINLDVGKKFNDYQELNPNIVRSSEDWKGTDGVNADIEYYFKGEHPRLTIARKVLVRNWKELKGFARDLNTLHGWLLRINELLLTGDIETRDEKTVQGCINKLNDIFAKFDELIPGELYGVDSSGRIAPVGFDDGFGGNSPWIELGTTQDENGKTVLKVIHKTDLFADDNIYVPTTDSNFVPGKVYYIRIEKVDEDGNPILDKNGNPAYEYKQYTGGPWIAGLYEKAQRNPSNRKIFGYPEANSLKIISPTIDNAGHVDGQKVTEVLLADLLLKSNNQSIANNVIATLNSPKGNKEIKTTEDLRTAIQTLSNHINEGASNITLNEYDNYYNDVPYFVTNDEEKQPGKTYYIKQDGSFVPYTVDPWPENHPVIYEKYPVVNNNIPDVDDDDNINEAIAKLQWQLNHIANRKLTDLTNNYTDSTAPLADTDTLGQGLNKLQNRIYNIENFEVGGLTDVDGDTASGLTNIFAGIVRSSKVPTSLGEGYDSETEVSVPALRSGWIWVYHKNADQNGPEINYVYIKVKDGVNIEVNNNKIDRNYWELLNAWQ